MLLIACYFSAFGSCEMSIGSYTFETCSAQTHLQEIMRCHLLILFPTRMERHIGPAQSQEKFLHIYTTPNRL